MISRSKIKVSAPGEGLVMHHSMAESITREDIMCVSFGLSVPLHKIHNTVMATPNFMTSLHLNHTAMLHFKTLSTYGFGD